MALCATSYLHYRQLFFRRSWRRRQRRHGVAAAVASAVKVRNDAHDDNTINHDNDLNIDNNKNNNNKNNNNNNTLITPSSLGHVHPTKTALRHSFESEFHDAGG